MIVTLLFWCVDVYVAKFFCCKNGDYPAGDNLLDLRVCMKIRAERMSSDIVGKVGNVSALD